MSMSALVHEIKTIRSLRGNVRNQTLSDTVMKAITMIHQSIASNPENQSSKKSEWRGGSAPSTQQGFRGASASRGNFFGGARQHAPVDGRRFRNTNHSKEVVSVPLDHHSSSESTDIPDDDGFETVRKTNRPHRRGNGEESRMHPMSNAAVASSSTTPSEPVVFRSNPPQKYVSRFRKENDKVEDIILNKILLGKLNKFSSSNYNEIKEFITHIIDNGETEMIKCFMKLVFEKAASEEMFCPLYARLLSELSAKYPILLDEIKNLYTQYMEIFEEIPNGINSSDSYQELCKRNVEKKYRRGYSQFLAELIKYNVINMDMFVKTVSTIIHQTTINLTNKESIKLIEEYADCLMKIMKAIKLQAPVQEDVDEDEKTSDLSNEIRHVLKTEYMEQIHPLTVRQIEHVGLSNKARFTFLDIYEEIQKFKI